MAAILSNTTPGCGQDHGDVKSLIANAISNTTLPGSCGQDHGDVKSLIANANYMYHCYKYKEAFESYKTVEKIITTNGHVNYRLGVMYFDGHHIERDHFVAIEYFKIALEYLTKSADAGDAESQCDLGYMYYYGRGTVVDHEKSIHFYKLAADQGHCRAQNNLGHMFRDGHGTKTDKTMACKLYKQSGDCGYDSLAWMYLNGYGIKRDKKQAVLLYQLAYYQGYIRARESLKEIFKDLTEFENEEYAALGPKYLSEQWPTLGMHVLLKKECQDAILEFFCIFRNISYGSSIVPVELIILLSKELIIAWPRETFNVQDLPTTTVQ